MGFCTLVLTISACINKYRQPAFVLRSYLYSWNSQTYNSAGTYSVTLPHWFYRLRLRCYTQPFCVTNDHQYNQHWSLSLQLPYSWNSQTINAAGTYTATLTGSNGCDSVATSC